MRQISRRHPASIEKCTKYFELRYGSFTFRNQILFRDEFENKLDENGKKLKQIELELIDAKSALSSTLKNMGKRLVIYHFEPTVFWIKIYGGYIEVNVS